jgi:hypothetical protein
VGLSDSNDQGPFPQFCHLAGTAYGRHCLSYPWISSASPPSIEFTLMSPSLSSCRNPLLLPLHLPYPYPCPRVLGLLRGLTASLDVSQSYLEVMTPYARKALWDRYAEQQLELSSKQDITASHSTLTPSISKVGRQCSGGTAQTGQDPVTCSVFRVLTPVHHASHSALISAPLSTLPLLAPFVPDSLYSPLDHRTHSCLFSNHQDVRGEDKLGGIAELVQRLVDSGDVLGCQVETRRKTPHHGTA